MNESFSVLSCLGRVQLFAGPWTVARQAPLSMGFSRQEYWSGLPCLPPGDLPDPGIEPTSARVFSNSGGFFTPRTTWGTPNTGSVQFSRSVMSNSLRGLPHARPLCPSLSPGVCSNSIESVMPSNHLILCRPLLLQTSVFPSDGGFSNESALRIWWAKYWRFIFSISPSREYSGLIAFRIECTHEYCNSF